MAQFKHISSSLRLTISLGEEEGKTVTKTVSLSNIGAAATADTLSALAPRRSASFSSTPSLPSGSTTPSSSKAPSAARRNERKLLKRR